MKKRLFLILVMVVVLLLTSCTPNVSTENTQPKFSGQESVSKVENTTPQTSMQDTTTIIEEANLPSYLSEITPIIWTQNTSGDVIRLNYENTEKYDAYFSEFNVQPELVYYEKLTEFGEFRNYMEYAHPSVCTHTQYRYGLFGADDYRFSIDIFHYTTDSLAKYEYVQLDFAECDDLRYSPIEDLPAPAILEKDGFIYKYGISGQLNSINWVENGIHFKITGQSMLGDYPAGTDTLLGKLLYTDTFHEAAETIRNMKLTEGLPCGMVGKDSAAYPAGYWEALSKATPEQKEEIESLSRDQSTLEFHRESMIRLGALDKDTPRLTLEQVNEIVSELKAEYTQNGVKSFAAICPTFLTRFNEIAGAPDIRDRTDDYGDWITYVYILDESTGEKICVREDGLVFHMKGEESKTIFNCRKYIEKHSE